MMLSKEVQDNDFNRYKYEVKEVYNTLSETPFIKDTVKLLYKKEYKLYNKYYKKFLKCDSQGEVDALTDELFMSDNLIAQSLWTILMNEYRNKFEANFMRITTARDYDEDKDYDVITYHNVALFLFLIFNDKKNIIANLIIKAYNNNNISARCMDSLLIETDTNSAYDNNTMLILEKYAAGHEDNLVTTVFAAHDTRGVRKNVFDAINFRDSKNADYIMKEIYINDIKDEDIRNEFKRRIITEGLTQTYISNFNNSLNEGEKKYTINDFYKDLPADYQVGVII